MKKAFLIVSVALLLSSCAITLPVNATSNEVGSKVGMSKATGYLNVLWFDQDASIQKAAKQGGITKISTVDLKQTNMLGIIQTYECIVTGN
jgi:starvation-inducible outer membrane lipoprotein